MMLGLSRKRAAVLVGLSLLVISLGVKPAPASASDQVGGNSSPGCVVGPFVLWSGSNSGLQQIAIQFHITVSSGTVAVGGWRASTGSTSPTWYWQGPGSWWPTYQSGAEEEHSSLTVVLQPGAGGTSSYIVQKPANYGTCFSIDHVVVTKWWRNDAGSGGSGFATPTPASSGAPTPTPTPAWSPGMSLPPGYCAQQGPPAPGQSFLPPVPCSTPTPSPTVAPPAAMGSCTFPSDGNDSITGCNVTVSPGVTFYQGDVWRVTITFTFANNAALNHDSFISWAWPSTLDNCIFTPPVSGDTLGTCGWSSYTPHVNNPFVQDYKMGVPTGRYSNGDTVTTFHLAGGCPHGCAFAGTATLVSMVLVTPGAARPSPSPSPSPSSSASDAPPSGWPTNAPPDPIDPLLQSLQPVDFCSPGTVAASAAACDPHVNYSFAPASVDPNGVAQLVGALQERAPFGYGAQAIGALADAAGNAPGDDSGFGCLTIPEWSPLGSTDHEFCIPWETMAGWAAPLRFVFLAVAIGLFAFAFVKLASSTAKGG